MEFSVTARRDRFRRFLSHVWPAKRTGCIIGDMAKLGNHLVRYISGLRGAPV